MAVYACSDIHGEKQFYDAIVKELQPGDTVYFLGDAVDRGDQSWEVFKAILANPQFIFLKGNHEGMLADAMRQSLRSGRDYTHCYNEIRKNGGAITYKAWLADGKDPQWLAAIDALPISAIYTNLDGMTFFMSHSGADENATDDEKIWDRNHFLLKNNSQYDFIVHGHTPIPLLIKEQNIYNSKEKGKYDNYGAYWYSNDSKIDLDCGAVWTKCGVLLNLDTLEEIIFTWD